MYDEKKPLITISQYLETKGEKISQITLSRHLNNHYEKQRKNLDVREYLEDIKRKRIKVEDRKRDLLDRKVMAEQYLYNIMTEANVSKIGQFKFASAIKAANDIIGAIQDQLDTLNAANQQVLLVMYIFIQCYEEELRKANSNDAKKSLTSFYDSMSKAIEGLHIKEQ